jgi:hypothetical protein
VGTLNPLFLAATILVGVPLFLHLFQRQEARRVAFPALRYLARTEREHARRIRFRQILLLLLRMAVVLLLVGAGARLFLRGSGSAHPPTALAIVLDNSMSSGLVVGDERVLDHLKGLALQTLSAASDDDRIWVIRAGEPWLPAVPGGPGEARRLVEETTVSAGSGRLSEALRRAAELVSTADLAAREIHLLSDLQQSGFSEDMVAPAGDIPVVLWSATADAPANRALARVLVGGGLPPLEGQRSEVTIQAAPAPPADTVAVPVRVVLDGRVRGAGLLPPGASLALPLPSAPGGWTVGYADADPDALRADDRRYFVFRARPAPSVALVGDAGLFVAEAVAVLEAGQRLRTAGPRQAQAVLSAGGDGLESTGAGSAVLIIPPGDPTLLPGLNRRLQQAGIPWRYERSTERGEAEVAGDPLPEALRGIRVRESYRLAMEGDPSAPPRILGTVAGEPWALDGTDASGRRYLLLASPLDAGSTSLPVSADMIRFVDWVTGQWAAQGSGAPDRNAGDVLSAPRGAEAVRFPSGAEVPLDGTRTVTATGETGIYAFLAGDTVLAYEAVNPPSEESRLEAIEPGRLGAAIGTEVTRVRRDGGWPGAIYRVRQGPELWRVLVVAALLLLLVEAAVAATGPLRGTRRAKAAPGAVRVVP